MIFRKVNLVKFFSNSRYVPITISSEMAIQIFSGFISEVSFQKNSSEGKRII